MIIDVHFEDKILACLYGSGEFCAVAAQHLKPSYFDGVVKHNLSKLAIEFWDKYKTKISRLGFVEGMKELAGKKVIPDKDIKIYTTEYRRLLGLDITDWTFVLDKMILFIKQKETRRLIEDAVKTHLPKNDFEAIEKGIREISNITANDTVKPYSYFDPKRIEERSKAREADSLVKTIGISTGIKRMDDVFPKQGWWKKELYTLLAPPKRGKTMAMQYFANMSALQGFNTVIFTLETSREVYADRLDAMNSDTEIKKLSKHFKDVEAKVAAIKTEGNLLIFEYPTKRLTVDGLERHLRKLEIEDKFNTDILFVDYADLLRPAKGYDDKLYEQATIFEDLRALATIFEIPVITASQVNRVGSTKDIITGKDVSGTWDKIMVSDAIITLSASEDDLKKEHLKIHFAECRNMERKTLTVKTNYSIGKFYKEFVGEEE